MGFEESQKEKIYKGTQFWKEAIERAGVKNKLQFFNDVITEQRPPHGDGYHLVLGDIVLDGKKCDIYHTDQNINGKIKGHYFARIFIHTKE